MPVDWKPFSRIGPGTCEIRVASEDGAFRVMYVAKFEEAIYVLHCFQKYSRKTDERDVEIAAKRYREVVASPGVV